MGIKGWARMLAEEGFLPDQAGIISCCSESLWRNVTAANELGHVDAIPPRSKLHIDGNGLAFFLHQIAYARQIDEAINHKRRSEKICAVPQELTTAVHAFLPNFLSLRILHEVTKEFIDALHACKMHLIVYWDGDARRVYKQQTDAKRSDHRTDGESNLHQYCLHGRLPACASVCQWEYEFPKTRLFKTQVIHTLRQLNVEMLDCPEEADPYMARVACGDPRSFIVGNDTDFCAFKDVQYVPFSTIHASTRGSLTASVIRRRDIADRLGLDDGLMVELAILCGNDYIPDPSTAGLSFFSRNFVENVEFLQGVEPGFRLATSNEDMEEVLAFIRASYELESLDAFPLEEDDSDDDDETEDLGSVLEDELNITMDLDAAEDLAVKIDNTLLRVRPTEDKSVLDAVIRCLEHHVDSDADVEDEACLIRPIHVEALRKLTLTAGFPSMPVTWRPEWKDVVAVHIIEKCLDAAYDMNNKVPLVKLRPPHSVFDQWRYHVLMSELRDPTSSLPVIPSTEVTTEMLHKLLRPQEPPKPIAPLKLPIDEYEDEILNMISANRISVIQGETGCGKSSRIPAMLLKRLHDVKLFISQPRRIAAKALVERLRECEPTLRDVIALRMGHGHKEYESNGTKAWFVTTGYLVRLMANHPERFDNVTHLIIDEVHERSVDTDILCLLCRRLLVTNQNIRLVLMSATLAAALYQEYFDIPHPPLKVGARRFPVEEVYLEDLAARFDLPGNIKKAVATIKQGCDTLKCRSSPNSQIMEKLHSIACHLALVVGTPGSSVLIFVPGMMDIVSITERVEQLYVPGVRFTCFPIHSDIPFDDQMNVFAPAECDQVKVIIATNAAESSVTLPDVDHVICLGLCKQILYNELSHRQILTPTWISKASATQRAGRTGRLRPGTCYRLYTRQNYEEHMEAFEPGEILRTPLDSVILMLKEMLKDEEVTEVLNDCIEPPNIATIERSFKSLYDSQFITAPSGDCNITELGLFVSALGVDLALGSLVGLGIQFGVASEVLQLAGILSFPQPPWIMSNPLVHDAQSFNEMTKRTFISRCHFDANLFSEPLAAMNLLWEFDQVKQDSRKANAFCQKHGLVVARLRRLLNTCSNLRLRVATYFDIAEDNLKVKEPPSRMPHAKVTVLRVLQAWVFCDSILECRATPSHRDGLTVDGYALELGPKSDSITEEHLNQVVCRDKHPFTLSGFVESEQRVGFPYTPGDLEAGRYDERFLSYAIEKRIQIIWLWDNEYMVVYVAQDLFLSPRFATLATKLRERLEESIVVLEPNRSLRGVGERPSGRWKLSSDWETTMEDSDVPFYQFYTGVDKAPKKKLENMRKFHLYDFLKSNSSVKGLSCNLAGVIGSYGCGELSAVDVKDLLMEPNIMLTKGKKKSERQTILFKSSPNSPMSKASTGGVSSSWERPLFDCIPEGVRLLTILASSRRKGDHGVSIQGGSLTDGAEPDLLKIHLDRSKTKLQGRWKRLGTDSDVYTSENSVPATALSMTGDNLYCVASNTLEIRGGGLKVEGLTLLPPGQLFLLLTRVSFGLQSVPKNLALNPDKADFMASLDRLQEALDLHESTKNLGEELRCFPEKARRLCDLFDGVDGFEGGEWDIDSNPFTHENYDRLTKGLESKKSQRASNVSQRVNVPRNASVMMPTPVKESVLSTHLNGHTESLNSVAVPPRKLSKAEKRKAKEAKAQAEVAVTEQSQSEVIVTGRKLTKAEKRKAREAKAQNQAAVMELSPSELTEQPQPAAATTDRKLTKAEKRYAAKVQMAAVAEAAQPAAKTVKTLKPLGRLCKRIPQPTMHQLFASDYLQRAEIPDTEPPSSNILAHLVRTYRQLNVVAGAAEEMPLIDPADWLLYVFSDNGQRYYQARFQGGGIRFVKYGKQDAAQLPVWFADKHTPMRPTVEEDALMCLPLQFREACAKSMKTVETEKKKNSLVFDSIDMAVRFEASFWLQRHFLTVPELKNWYDQDPAAMLDKLLARNS